MPDNMLASCSWDHTKCGIGMPMAIYLDLQAMFESSLISGQQSYT